MLETPHPNGTTIRGLYFQALERSRIHGVRNYDEYRDLVQELIQQKLNEGEFDADDDIEQIERDLELLWPEVEKVIMTE